MYSKDVNNSFDALFDLNRDGILNSAEYSEQLYYINQDAERWQGYYSHKQIERIGNYVQAIGDCAMLLVDECKKVEEAYNTIEKEWREGAKNDDELNVYISKDVLEEEGFFPPLKDLLSDDSFRNQLVQIRKQSDSITKRMKSLQNKCIRGFEIWYNTLLDFYNGYMIIVECLLNLNNSYYCYVDAFLAASDECFAYYKNFDSLAKSIG